MLQFVIRKMLNKKWMVLALLVGNILLVSIAAANPMYTDAVLQRTLETALSDSAMSNGRYPMTYSVKTTALFSNVDNILESIQVLKDSGERYGLPVSRVISIHRLLTDKTESDLARSDRIGDITVIGMSDLENHIDLIEGTGMTEAPDADGIIDVVVSEEAFVKQEFLLGEVLTFTKDKNPDGEPLKLRIAGVFREDSATDPYWSPLSRFTSGVFIHSDLFYSYFIDTDETFSVSSSLYAEYDYSNLTVSGVSRVLEARDYYNAYFDTVVSQSADEYFGATLENFQKTAKKVRTTFLILQVPIYVLLAAFIFMVSKQMLDMEQGEIAVLKSRGSSRVQVIGVYLLQSIITAVIALLIGIPLAFWLVRVLGATNAFLEFVNRKSLQVEIHESAFIYAFISAAFSIATMVIPVFKHSRVTIVNHKQTKHRSSDKPLWQKFFLDVIILGVSLYGLYSFNNQKEMLAQRVLEGESLDPLLFLSASLFMLGAGLFALRILPLFVKLIFTLFKNSWSPALYTSFVRIIRTRKQQGFIMVFLVMTIALGIFDASAARTINGNDEDNLRYMTAADIILQEKWSDNSNQISQANVGGEDAPDLMYKEPDFSRFTELEGAESLTKVLYDENGFVNLDQGTLKNVQIMGINTKEFGQTAYFDTSLLPEHWNNYLNALAQKASAVIVSSNFRDDYGYKISDVIYYRTGKNNTARGVIYGFVDYWPGYASSTLQKGDDGVIAENKNYLVIGNLAEMQERWGITPYQIWIRAKDSTQFIYDFLEKDGTSLATFTDYSAEKVRHKNDATLQGTNGILTVGFIAVLLLCTVGFLIYWILSIRSRELQFGIFRAMGMSMREIITMLINEHIWISGASILAGALVGKLTSRLYMPLIQIAYSSIDNALPLKIITDPADDIRLTVIVGIMILGCLLILGWLIRKMKIAQALKLGED